MKMTTNKMLKGAGVAVLAATLAGPAFALNPNFAALLAAIKANQQPPLEPTGRLVSLDRSQFFVLLGRDDPRSPN